LPAPFRPRLVHGSAVGGLCFLRLRNLRVAGIPAPGVTTENVAHRFAVIREDLDGPAPCVFIPRRDTSSQVAAWLGGRLVEGELNHATFDVTDSERQLAIRVEASGGYRVEVSARPASEPASTLFSSLEEESSFYQDAAVAYSPNQRRRTVEAVELDGERWSGTPMAVGHFRSSFFDDERHFPRGSWELDSAMVVRNVRASWRTAAATSDRSERVGALGAPS
jgi:hypothetical protein